MSYNWKTGVLVFFSFSGTVFFTSSSPTYMTIYMTEFLWRDFLWRKSDDAPSNDAYGDLADIVDFCGAEALPSIEQTLWVGQSTRQRASIWAPSAAQISYINSCRFIEQTFAEQRPSKATNIRFESDKASARGPVYEPRTLRKSAFHDLPTTLREPRHTHKSNPHLFHIPTPSTQNKSRL